MPGMAIGSAGYMAPEQVKGAQPDPRSDLYSLGVTLYEVVTGQRPFQGENDYAFLTINGNANFFKLADMHDSRLHDSTFFLQAFSSETGWQSFSFRVDTATSYTLGIGVMDIGDTDAVDSALLADTVALSAVPEP